jgi:diguanylate cyclase (GGDEF)-like protein/PAS domain S-box-containing protein
MLKGETIHIPRVADLPSEANAEKKEFNLASIKSLINVPMIYRKSVIGFLGFDSVRKEKIWPEDNIMLIKIIGEIFVNALVRKQVEEALRESEDRYRTIFEDSRDAIYITTRDGIFVDCNQSASDLFGYTRDEMIGMNALQIYVNPDDRSTFQQEIEQTGSVRNYKIKFKKKNGTEMDCLLTTTVRKNADGTVFGYQGIIRDVTELKKVEDQLRYLSLHDPLTGLYNRAYFEEEMHRVESGRYDSAGIIMCDVDGLKLVNDALGHYTGDNLLMATANILKESFREGDVAARVGGDEFAVLLPNSDSNAIEIARLRIQDAVERHNSSNPPLPLSISIGSAIGTGSSIIMTNLFKEADNNMYREKLQHSLSARSTIVQTLMKALETRDFTAKGHISRLQKLSTDLAISIGLQEQIITDLRLLAEFHDIGKVGISDHILFKTGPLTSEEIIEMQRHCEVGHRIALCTPDLVTIADLILKHHEWWNGKGYPLGIEGENIPLECRILAIVETYEAMTSDRPYHKAISREEAMAELRRRSGTKFDPDLVTKFIEILENIKE